MGLLGLNSTIPFYNSANSVADIVARSHYQRVIDDGGVIDDYQALLDAINGLFDAYDTNNLPAFLAAAIDPAIFGYKVGAGSGTTLGRAASKLYSLMGASSDVVQNTAAAQPLLLRWNSTDGNYLFLSGQNGNKASTPNAASNQFSSNLDIKCKIQVQNESLFFLSKRDLSANISYWFAQLTGGVLTVRFSSSGGAVPSELFTSTAALTLPLNSIGWVRCVRNNAIGQIIFYQSSDGINWVQVGATINYTPYSLFNSSVSVTIGDYNDNSSGTLGKVYRVMASNVIDGSASVDFNTNDYDVSISQNTLESQTTGETWTINRSTATTGYKAQITTRSTIQSDGVDDRLTTGTLTTTIPQPTSKYFFMEQLSWTSNDYLAAFSAMSIFQTSLSPNIQAFTGGGAIDFIGEQLNRIQALTNVQDGASSLNQVNNGAETTGTQGAVAINQINLLSDQTARFGNFVLNTCIISRQNDNATTRTAVYNLARGWNGNPA